MKSKIDKIIDKWAKKHRWDYDCYKKIIQELKDRLNKESLGAEE